MSADKASYKEEGTSLSGYSENGPYHCEDCVHLKEKNKCVHPVVVVDPEMKKHKSGDGWVEVDPEYGCCRFVRAIEEKEKVSHPLLKVIKSKT